MNLLDNFPSKDLVLLNDYINYYGGSGNDESYLPLDKMNYFLRFWNEAKAPFYEAFNNQFIIKKEFSYNKNLETMEDEFDQKLCYGAKGIIWGFRQDYRSHVRCLGDSNLSDKLMRFVSDPHMLIKNEYDGESFIIPKNLTVTGKDLKVPTGAKVIRMLKKICDALDICYTEYRCKNCGRIHVSNKYDCDCGEKEFEFIDGYEAFRREHSMILNQKTVTGNLCLSIHPLDFITMSDNDLNWESCMEWMHPGDYRVGTLEMMNSRHCIVAYVEDKKDMEICANAHWNNKRWRQLLMVTPELLLGNKQYPFKNDDIEEAAMSWLRDLLNNATSNEFGPYDNKKVEIHNCGYNIIDWKNVYVNLYFDKMYNDIYDSRNAYASKNLKKDTIAYNLSGPAVCTNCGGLIEEGIDTSWTVCMDCSGAWRCGCCGSFETGYAHYADDSDVPLCEYCYREETVECPICGDSFLNPLETVYIKLIPDEHEESSKINTLISFEACSHCIENNDDPNFGEFTSIKNPYGARTYFVDVNNFNEDAFWETGVGYMRRNLLQSIQGENDVQRRIDLVKNSLFDLF